MTVIGKLLSVAFCAVLLAGCGSLDTERNVENSKNLRIGMTKDQVLEIMGQPLSGESYNTPDIWFYKTRTEWADGLVTRDECLPLVFSDGKLIGWGSRYYNNSRMHNSEDR
ncbi:MAG: DUF3192 domain-containing protein [Victivallaceae bacterium]|nr:DUF3192 domain-containing protein [Victivallaceae bacterium]